MELLIRDLCGLLVNHPVSLAVVLCLLFGAVGFVYLSGVNGRRRLYDKKADKEKVNDLKMMVAQAQLQIFDLAMALGKRPNPLSPETIELANGNNKV